VSRQMPAEYVAAFFDFFGRGSVDETSVWPTVEQVTDRPPGTFAQLAMANAAGFR
jgi:hypothetical protein